MNPTLKIKNESFVIHCADGILAKKESCILPVFGTIIEILCVQVENIENFISAFWNGSIIF